MDQRELATRLKAFQKAISDNEPPANIISILESLKNEVVATEDLLRATKAGMVVAKQRAHPDKQVAKLAQEIVAKWRRAVDADKQKKDQKLAAKGELPKFGMSEAQSQEKFKGDVSKRKWDTDKIDVKRTGVPSRDSILGLLYNGLAFMSEEPPMTIILKAMEVEKAAFEAYKGETTEYKSKLRSLFQNLKIPNNRELGQAVLSGQIAPEKFVRMTHDELKSAERRKQDTELEKDNMKKSQVPMAEKSISDALRCGRCGQKKVHYTQAQTRSADEPMTTFCECSNCGHRWKFS
ncbi:transcription elongation factor S-II [Bisporella sp. PMI_857]|nr:transcription elongation factor S-II [Bisporella sp. PMI_857]